MTTTVRRMFAERNNPFCPLDDIGRRTVSSECLSNPRRSCCHSSHGHCPAMTTETNAFATRLRLAVRRFVGLVQTIDKSILETKARQTARRLVAQIRRFVQTSTGGRRHRRGNRTSMLVRGAKQVLDESTGRPGRIVRDGQGERDESIAPRGYRRTSNDEQLRRRRLAQPEFSRQMHHLSPPRDKAHLSRYSHCSSTLSFFDLSESRKFPW